MINKNFTNYEKYKPLKKLVTESRDGKVKYNYTEGGNREFKRKFKLKQEHE